MAMNEQKRDEGVRSFGRFLEMLDDGAAHSNASAELKKLVNLLRAEAKDRHRAVKGVLTLTLDVECDETGTLEVNYALKTKEPKARSSKTVLWLTAGGNVTPENPRQQHLALREVGGAEVKDINEPKAAQEV